jgi:hypothetical protein
MAQAMLDFFDDKYLSENCICELDEKNCSVHNKKTRQEEFNQTESPIMKTSKQNDFDGDIVLPVQINQSFPRQPAEHLMNLIEYRIKVLSTSASVFQPGETRKLLTNTSISRKPGRLSLLMKPADFLPLRFLSEGIICSQYRGILSVDLLNSSNEPVLIPANTIIAYLILSPFI